MNAGRFQSVLMVALTALVAVLLVTVGFLGRVITEPDPEGSATAAVSTEAVDFTTLGEILDILERDYVEPDRIDPRFMYESAIRGMFDALGDPHSTYIDPESFAVGRDDFSGAFSGIGATVSTQERFVVVVAVLPDTPAEMAGLSAGDVILAVDGEDAEGWSVEQAVLRIRGPRGTTVDLRVRHRDNAEETLTIERDEILVSSVSTTPPGGVLRDEDGEAVSDYAYVQIRSFTRRTPDELRDAVEAAEAAGARGLVIDVRGNPGGLLVETAQIADFFLEDGTILVQVDRGGAQREFNARPGTITDLPIVIVQDEFSASGSEVLAAALSENGRATIVGAHSFGKGTVNNLRELSTGGAVYVSVARWLTPERNQIEGNGILPDIPVEPTIEDIEAGRDVAVGRAIAVLRAATAAAPAPAAAPAS